MDEHCPLDHEASTTGVQVAVDASRAEEGFELHPPKSTSNDTSNRRTPEV